MDLGNYHLVINGFWGEKFGDFEIMDEVLVALVIKGEVEVDQFVYVQVLEAGVVGDRDG